MFSQTCAYVVLFLLTATASDRYLQPFYIAYMLMVASTQMSRDVATCITYASVIAFAPLATDLMLVSKPASIWMQYLTDLMPVLKTIALATSVWVYHKHQPMHCTTVAKLWQLHNVIKFVLLFWTFGVLAYMTDSHTFDTLLGFDLWVLHGSFVLCLEVYEYMLCLEIYQYLFSSSNSSQTCGPLAANVLLGSNTITDAHLQAMHTEGYQYHKLGASAQVLCRVLAQYGLRYDATSSTKSSRFLIH